MKTLLSFAICLLTCTGPVQAKNPLLPAKFAFGDSFSAVDKKLKGKATLDMESADPTTYSDASSEAHLPYTGFDYAGNKVTLRLNFTYGKLTEVDIKNRRQAYDYQAVLKSLERELGTDESCNNYSTATCTWELDDVKVEYKYNQEKSNTPEGDYKVWYENKPLKKKLREKYEQ